jgi:mRNA interferase MazF
MCPITSRKKGYPFEVDLPDDLAISGVVLADQVKSLDWSARDARVADSAPEPTTMQVLGKLGTLLS